MNDDTDYTGYAFQYTVCDGKVYNTTINNPGPTWMECLDDFVRFLEGVYKQNILEQVRIHDSKEFKDAPWGYIDPWTGEYFSDDEEEESKDDTHFSWDE